MSDTELEDDVDTPSPEEDSSKLDYIKDVADLDRMVKEGIKPLPRGNYQWKDSGIKKTKHLDERTWRLVNAWLRQKAKDIEATRKDFVWTCTVCNETGKDTELKYYNHRNHLLLHLKKKLPKPEGKLQCQQCSASYVRKGDLKRHVRLKHSSDPETLLTCEHCSKTFIRPDKYKDHILIHRKAGLACSVCGRRFKTENVIRGHLHRVHKYQKLGTLHSCPYCREEFTTLSKREVHIVEEHASRLDWLNKELAAGDKFLDKIINDEELVMTDVNKNALGAHAQCSYCGSTFSNRSALFKHIKTKHKTNPVKSHFHVICRFCDLDSRTLVESEWHVIEKHFDELDWMKTNIKRVERLKAAHNKGKPDNKLRLKLDGRNENKENQAPGEKKKKKKSKPKEKSAELKEEVCDEQLASELRPEGAAAEPLVVIMDQPYDENEEEYEVKFSHSAVFSSELSSTSQQEKDGKEPPTFRSQLMLGSNKKKRKPKQKERSWTDNPKASLEPLEDTMDTDEPPPPKKKKKKKSKDRKERMETSEDEINAAASSAAQFSVLDGLHEHYSQDSKKKRKSGPNHAAEDVVEPKAKKSKKNDKENNMSRAATELENSKEDASKKKKKKKEKKKDNDKDGNEVNVTSSGLQETKVKRRKKEKNPQVIMGESDHETISQDSIKKKKRDRKERENKEISLDPESKKEKKKNKKREQEINETSQDQQIEVQDSKKKKKKKKDRKETVTVETRLSPESKKEKKKKKKKHQDETEINETSLDQQLEVQDIKKKKKDRKETDTDEFSLNSKSKKEKKKRKEKINETCSNKNETLSEIVHDLADIFLSKVRRKSKQLN